MELLVAILASAQDDRLHVGVIKIGPFDERFDNADYFESDGEPAYGQIPHLHITNDEGGTLIGEFPFVVTGIVLLGEALPAPSGLGGVHEAF